MSASGTRDWRPRYPRSIRNRLAIGSLLVTAAAIVSVYLYVVPQLRTRLQDQKLQALVVAAQHYTAPVLSLVGTSANERVVDDAVRAAAANAGARVTLLGTSNGTEGLSVFVLSDSTREAQPEPERDALALRAARSGQVQLATVRTPNGGLAEAARPLYLGRELADVIVYASPLADIPGNVAAVRQQILVAGGIALILAALIVGSALLASSHNNGSAVTNTIALTIFVIAAITSLALLAWMGLASRKVRAHRRS